MSTDFFSSSYAEARERFREAARAVGASIESLTVDASEDLTIDACMIGSDSWPTVMVTSGVHGVEGFFGSASQLALLDRLKKGTLDVQQCRLVLVHSVNPYGFAQIRRGNEHNVDLNRNGLLPGERFAGATDGYRSLDSFLNPIRTPRHLWLFPLQMIQVIRRAGGMPAMKATVASGQYEFPTGLFFGGREPASSTRLLAEAVPQWFAQTPRVLCLDLHSGLGKHGHVTLLNGESGRWRAWHHEAFPAEAIEDLVTGSEVSYAFSGVFPGLLQWACGQDRFRWIVPEFGTYGPIRVLSALRMENHAHHHLPPDSPVTKRAKARLLECFCPKSPRWRDQVVRKVIELVEQGTQAIDRPW